MADKHFTPPARVKGPYVHPEHGEFDVEYVRADIADEMLEALERAVPYVEDCLANEDGFLTSRDRKIVAAMEATIAKAKGREEGAPTL